MMTFKEAVADAAKSDISLFCYEGENEVSLKTALSGEKPETVSFIVGPEGGFSAKEADAAADAGLRTVTLGRRILRTETAASFVLACLSYEFE